MLGIFFQILKYLWINIWGTDDEVLFPSGYIILVLNLYAHLRQLRMLWFMQKTGECWERLQPGWRGRRRWPTLWLWRRPDCQWDWPSGSQWRRRPPTGRIRRPPVFEPGKRGPVWVPLCAKRLWQHCFPPQCSGDSSFTQRRKDFWHRLLVHFTSFLRLKNKIYRNIYKNITNFF